jgi:epoxyqueuosine reductase
LQKLNAVKMLASKDIKDFALKAGAEKCGIASIGRFADAPKGFHPTDIYKDCQSVIVFLKQMPIAIISAINPVPYSHSAYMIYAELDRTGMELSRFLQKKNMQGVPVPSDVPYIFWDEKRKHGQGILSMRHSAYLAGLGFLGRNNLLINEDLGNMAYIGAVLTNAKLEPDPLLTDFKCPPKCRICLDVCPPKALNGITVNQKLCRKFSFYKNERGFDIYDCNKCRKSCILMAGKKKKNTKLI